MSQARLAIIQPYVARYQVPFFDQLTEDLNALGVETAVLHGSHSGMRGDDASLRNAIRVDTTSLPGPLRKYDYKHVRRALGQFRPDLLVLEQALGHVEAYPALISSRFRGPSVAWWGHGRAYHRDETRVASSLRTILTNRADWFFAYSAPGADYVVRHGFPRTRITILNNTLDTSSLKRELAAIDEDTRAAFRRSMGLTRGRTALFLGAVDEVKGVELLLSAADRVARSLPGFKLLVAGQGDAVFRVKAAASASSTTKYLGRMEGAQKALALSCADVMVIPRGVGLVAIDSLVSGVPIVTTIGPGHGPEFDYLEAGRTCVLAERSSSSLAEAIERSLGDATSLSLMRRDLLAEAPSYSLDHMVGAFVAGVRSWNELRMAGLCSGGGGASTRRSRS